MNSVTIRVPATTANLGPGFDCLGLALGLYNEITFTEIDAGLTIDMAGEGAARLPRDEANLVYRAAQRLFAEIDWTPAGLHIQQQNNIPVGSGLGSSAAAVAGGLFAANALSGGRLSVSALHTLATEIEGHPDNVVPALSGGLTLTVSTDAGLQVDVMPVPPLQAVIVLPDFDLPTKAARAALPATVPLADAIFNAGRTAAVVRALTAGAYDRLPWAMADRLHQPYRLPLVPGLAAAMRAAQDAGAAGVALSGAGPSLLALAPAGHEAIAAAAQAAFTQAGLASRSWVLSVDQQGCIAF